MQGDAGHCGHFLALFDTFQPFLTVFGCFRPLGGGHFGRFGDAFTSFWHFLPSWVFFLLPFSPILNIFLASFALFWQVQAFSAAFGGHFWSFLLFFFQTFEAILVVCYFCLLGVFWEVFFFCAFLAILCHFVAFGDAATRADAGMQCGMWLLEWT